MQMTEQGKIRALVLTGAAIVAIGCAMVLGMHATRGTDVTAPPIAQAEELTPPAPETPPAPAAPGEASYHTEVYQASPGSEEPAESVPSLDELLVEDAPAPAPDAVQAEPVIAPAPTPSAVRVEPLQLRWRSQGAADLDALTAWVSARGGFVIPTSEQHVLVRLPSAELAACLDYLAGQLEAPAALPESPAGAQPWSSLSLTIMAPE